MIKMNTQNVVIIAIVAILLVILVNKKKNSDLTPVIEKATQVSNSKVVEEVPKIAPDTSKQESNSDSQISVPVAEDDIPGMKFAVSHIEHTKEQIREKLKLSLDLPTEYSFKNISFDDIESATGFHGYDPATKTNLIIAGVRQVVGPAEVLKFLQENGPDLPGMKAEYLKNIPAPKRGVAHGGFNTPYVWEVSQGGSTLTVALVTRKDGAGSYLAILNGPNESLSNQEERFEALYDSMKAE